MVRDARSWLLRVAVVGAVGACGVACSSGGGAGVGFHPRPGTSWQWQLSGALDASVDAQVYDVDLFANGAAEIGALRARGRRVVCYFDTAYEPGRPDSDGFPEAVRGNPMVGWPGQRWVDVRAPAVLDVMIRRMELAVAMGCDAIEPDDVDAYQNDPGFPITYDDQLRFCRALAREAHARGLAIGLKNDLDQVHDLVGDFDFAVNEQCFEHGECAALAPFLEAGKAVFEAEYGTAALASEVCPQANALGLDTIIKNLDLDAWRIACR